MQAKVFGPLGQRLNQIARRWGDDHFDEPAGLVLFEHPQNGHVSGGSSHLLRESSYYAYTLLDTGVEADLRRAERILEQVLPKQNLDPESRYWACFTCEHEQDWATWENPDQNWAQFLGMIFGYILALDDEQRRLSSPLRDRLDAAFRLTVLASLRRDVDAAYTNIALLSSAVAAAGASLRKIDGAEAFSFNKLSHVLARARPTGTFDEYLSPTYYGTDLYALYSVEKFAETERLRTVAASLLDLVWNDVEFAYHPPTYQLGGPHSRAYGDNMLEYAAALKYYLFLATDGNYPLNDVETRHSHDCGSLSIIRTHQVQRRIATDVERPSSFRRVALPKVEGEAEKIQTQYQDKGFSLGTISEQNFWSQHRNLIAYWRAESDGQIGFAKSAWETATGDLMIPRFWSAQSGTGVLVGLGLPVAAEPGADFSHRLEFGLPAQITTHPDVPGGFTVKLPGMEVDVRPVALPGVNAPTVAASPDDIPALVWRWERPSPGQSYYWGAFFVSFTPETETPAMVTGIAARDTDEGFSLVATVDDESLQLHLTRYA